MQFPHQGPVLDLSLWYVSHRVLLNSGGSRISRRGGVDLIGGAVDPRGGYVAKILHVKTKESGPVGGARAGRAPPRSANAKTN